MSLSAVHGTLTSLKSCQADIGTGMDIVTYVAMDLAESCEAGHPGIAELETMLLECAKLDREINHFVDTVQQVTEEATTQQPEAMFSLSAKVKEQFTERIARLSDAELQSHQKVVAFNESIKSSASQANKEAEENMEELDEDIAVTQSQANFTCPLTQVEMVNPVKNKKCNHHYDEGAILGLIKARHSQKKKCRCPVVGCGNTDVKQSDLVPDQMLKRRIQNQKRQNTRT
ncbi:E3 SUMO-protein ligase NSE2 [Halichoeres trimaculatus]|uniref:E3 SUMO-protein ligase NSE2 n=1 Tax=Halichoeres trimaculatus TaxID=147232 RepID=UPI003D9F4745